MFFLKKKAVRLGQSCELKCLSDLLHEADARLFRKMANNKEHSSLFTISNHKNLPVNLRHSRCFFALSQCHFNLYKRLFLLRNLFDDAYLIIVG